MKRSKFRIGHPAYNGDNRQADNLTRVEAFKELVSRGVSDKDAREALDKAMQPNGPLVAVWTETKSVIEVARYP